MNKRKQEIQKRIKENNLKSAINSLSDYFDENNKDESDELILLEGRLNRLKKDRISGIISDDVARLEERKIAQLILELASEILGQSNEYITENVTLTIQEEYSRFSRFKESLLRTIIAAFFRIPRREINIVRRRKGSVIIDLKISLRQSLEFTIRFYQDYNIFRELNNNFNEIRVSTGTLSLPENEDELFYNFREISYHGPFWEYNAKFNEEISAEIRHYFSWNLLHLNFLIQNQQTLSKIEDRTIGPLLSKRLKKTTSKTSFEKYTSGNSPFETLFINSLLSTEFNNLILVGDIGNGKSTFCLHALNKIIESNLETTTILVVTDLLLLHDIEIYEFERDGRYGQMKQSLAVYKRIFQQINHNLFDLFKKNEKLLDKFIDFIKEKKEDLFCGIIIF